MAHSEPSESLALARACRLHERALALHDRGELAAARTAAASSRKLLRHLLGPRHPDLANVTLELAQIALSADDPATGERLAADAVAILAGLRGDLEIRRLRVQVLRTRSFACRLLGRLDEAERHGRRALRLAEAAYPADDPALANCHNDLGVIAKFRGLYRESANYYRHALKIFTARHGREHPALAALYHNLGGLAHARGRNADAERLARRSLALRERVCAVDDLELAADRAALAAILDTRGRRDEAERLYHEALAVYVARRANYEVAFTRINLAALLHADGRLEASESHYRRAIRWLERARGMDHPDLGLALNNFGALLVDRGRIRAALARLTRAREILSRALVPGHPQLLACAYNLERATTRRVRDGSAGSIR